MTYEVSKVPNLYNMSGLQDPACAYWTKNLQILGAKIFRFKIWGYGGVGLFGGGGVGSIG